MPKSKIKFLPTPEGRFSYMAVFEKAEFEGGKSKYAVTLIIPKETDITELKAMATEAVRAKWGNEPPANLKTPFLDGDEKPEWDGYAGKTYMRFTSVKVKPAVMNSMLKPIINPDDIKDGDYGKVSCNAYTWTYMGKSGVSFGFNGIVKTRDGEPLGGAGMSETRAKSIFGEPTPVESENEENYQDMNSLF